MKTWFNQHLAALAQAFRHSFKPRSGFLLNVLVVAIALALPFAGLTALENVRPVAQQLDVEPEISIFMGIDTPRDKAVALASDIRRLVQNSESAVKLEFVPRENALRGLKDKTNLSDAITALGSNPLPDAYILKLPGFQNANDATRIDTLAAQLKALPGVEFVQIDSAWVRRLAALLHILRLALLFLAATLGAVVVMVVFNTIRLQVLNHREEIEVSLLLGATNRYVARPFYYTGALLGLCAGVIALVAVALALQPLNGAIAEFARLYASDFQLMPLGVLPTGALLLVSATLGLMGSLLSVQRHLSRLAAD